MDSNAGMINQLTSDLLGGAEKNTSRSVTYSMAARRAAAAPAAAAELHPALRRACDEAAAVVRGCGTFVLRNAPGRTVLLPLPAWKLRAMSAKELLEMTAEEGSAAGSGEDAEEPRDGGAAGADDERRARRAAKRKRRRGNARQRKASASSSAAAVPSTVAASAAGDEAGAATTARCGTPVSAADGAAPKDAAGAAAAPLAAGGGCGEQQRGGGSVVLHGPPGLALPAAGAVGGKRQCASTGAVPPAKRATASSAPPVGAAPPAALALPPAPAHSAMKGGRELASVLAASAARHPRFSEESVLRAYDGALEARLVAGGVRLGACSPLIGYATGGRQFSVRVLDGSLAARMTVCECLALLCGAGERLSREIEGLLNPPSSMTGVL